MTRVTLVVEVRRVPNQQLLDDCGHVRDTWEATVVETGSRAISDDPYEAIGDAASLAAFQLLGPGKLPE